MLASFQVSVSGFNIANGNSLASAEQETIASATFWGGTGRKGSVGVGPSGQCSCTSPPANRRQRSYREAGPDGAALDEITKLASPFRAPLSCSLLISSKALKGALDITDTQSSDTRLDLNISPPLRKHDLHILIPLNNDARHTVWAG